jgi:uncharacterized membrane protein required for colicin V production
MTIGTMDIYLLAIIVAALVVGFFWGAVRSLMLLAGWLLAFVIGAYLQLQLGSYLASEWTNYLSSFSEMAAFGIIYIGILLAAPIFILASTKGTQQFFASQALDDVAGALVAMSVAVLGIAGLMVILATFYGSGEPFVDPAGGPTWTAQLYQSLVDSTIGGAIADRLIPVLGAILGPILPPDVREVMT